MRYEYRITKYDPRWRNADGHYTKDEWTSFAEVGKSVGGQRLTMAEYLAVEEKYLTVLHALLREAGVKDLELKDFENRKAPRLRFRSPMTLARALAFARLALREKVWGKLIASRRAYVHFGWDYYLYVGLSRRTPLAIQTARSLALFVEPLRSPYLKRVRRRKQVERRAAP